MYARQFCVSEIIFSDPDPNLALISDLGFGSGLFMKLKSTLDFTGALCFLMAQRILHPYLNCRSSKLHKKGNFFKSVNFSALYLLVRNRTSLGSGFKSKSENNYGFGSGS